MIRLIGFTENVKDCFSLLGRFNFIAKKIIELKDNVISALQGEFNYLDEATEEQDVWGTNDYALFRDYLTLTERLCVDVESLLVNYHQSLSLLIIDYKSDPSE